MWSWLFNAVYFLALLVWSPLILWQRWVHGKKRGGWPDRLWGAQLPAEESNPDAPLLWLHAVSVGEVTLLTTLVPALRERFPDFRFAISSTTDTGLALARERFPTAIVFRFPLDFSWAMKKVIRRLRPAAFVLTELEIWPNLLRLLQARQVPVLVVNGRLSEKSFARYRWLRWIMSPIFRQLSLVLVQTDDYRERFMALGVPKKRCRVTGSIKFDSARSDRDNPTTMGLRAWAGITDLDVVWLAGSTSAPEEEYVLQVFQRLRSACPRLKLVLVPRHRERFEEVAQLCLASGLNVVRRSQADSAVVPAWEILLVDTIGELSAWWGVAQIGFVGGSMGSRGGQSMIEPAGYGVAVCFGPNTANFRDVVALLLTSTASEVVKDSSELETFVRRCYADEDYRAVLGRNAQEITKSQTGATVRTIEAMAPYLSSSVRTLHSK